ncbi:MAG TPA: class I SAM-dependent methyltransferase [Thermoanaerobaculia bacterium]|jgi:SAM-dependent methyltransferase|nr:class I SAM-dependent methyltransferase [Thermoanaerobaculia bacterium]
MPRPTIDLVKLETAADAASPEAQYLLSWVVAQARQVWAEVTLRRQAPEAPLAAPADGGDLLLLGTGNVLVAARSLAAMAERRAGGTSVVVPMALECVTRPDDEPLYSLRGFERLESRWLAEPFETTEPARLLPISLLSADAVERCSPALPLPADDVARAGIYHQFVDYYGEAREDVLPFVPPHAHDVLEVGCGNGATGRLLQDRLGCRVTGVELNPAAAAAAARHLHRVVCGDVAEVALDGDFDAIVACELFEHLPEGEAVLRRLADHLRPGGRIVLSVPNVGHHSVVADLLAGRWDYLPIGLLCYTHYRFFTRRTLEDWMRRLGFGKVELVAQRTELPAQLAALAAQGGLEVDAESLSTKGFYVLIEA